MIGDIMYGNLRYEKKKEKPTKQDKQAMNNIFYK